MAAGKDYNEIKKLRGLRREVEAAFENSWGKNEHMEALAFEALYKLSDERRTREIINRLKKHHIPPDGKYFIYRFGDGTKPGAEAGKADRMALDSYKMVHYLFFILALEKLHEDELLDMVVQKTFEGLEACGDFYECYYVTGEPWGNGPMSIFGAFGWIWCLMEK